MKDMTSSSASGFKQALLTKALFLCLTATIIFTLAYKSKASIPPPGTDDPAEGRQELNLREAGRLAVLHWMAENSAMSEKVLSRVYKIAAGTIHSDLVLAICFVESNYNPRAVSEKGAMGLMGIMPNIWLDELQEQGIIKDKDDLYNIENNIAAGSYVLDRYLSRTGSIREALIRYEGGDSWYARRVLKTMKKISLVRDSGAEIHLASAAD